ncbi:MAG: hypothetical protein WA962_13560 [Ornithinimicrobium sp.]
MAGKGKAVGAALKYGPILYATSRRYGPVVWEQVKSQREPAERFVQSKVDKGNQRKKAVQHASTVINGSTLQVFHHNTAHWVVFSGEEPVGVHPRSNAPFSQLLKNADLSKRVRPEDEPTAAERLKGATRKRSLPTRRGQQRHAQADVDLRRGAPEAPEGPPNDEASRRP